MKGKTIILLSIITAVIVLKQMLVIIQPFDQPIITLRANPPHRELTLEPNTVVSSNTQSKLNSIVFSKIYYKQRRINTYSRNDIDFEIHLTQIYDDKEVSCHILLNQNELASTRLSSLSRVDYDVVYFDGLKRVVSYSVDLNNHQVSELLELVNSIMPQENN